MKISIASGKGGTGKTTVSVSLFQAFSKKYQGKVHLVDCDVEEPNDLIFFPEHSTLKKETINKLVPQINKAKCTYCRRCAEYCEFNAIVVLPTAEFAEVNKDLCHSCGACLVACEEGAITEIPEEIGVVQSYKIPFGTGLTEGRLKIGSTMQTMLIRELKTRIETDNQLILYDAPPGTSCPVVETISDSDYVVLVAEPTPFGLHDLKLMVDLIKEIDTDYGVIINKAGMGNNDIYDFLSENDIEILGEIPFMKEFAAKYAEGAILQAAPPEIEKSINQIVEQLDKIMKK